MNRKMLDLKNLHLENESNLRIWKNTIDNLFREAVNDSKFEAAQVFNEVTRVVIDEIMERIKKYKDIKKG